MGKNFIQGAIEHPGALHEDLGVPQGETIPSKLLNAAAKEGGVVGRRARFAKTLKKLGKKKSKKAPKKRSLESADDQAITRAKKMGF